MTKSNIPDPARLKEIRVRRAKITHPPWGVTESDSYWDLFGCFEIGDDKISIHPAKIAQCSKEGVCSYWPASGDSDFIVHAPEDIDYLLTLLADREEVTAEFVKGLEAEHLEELACLATKIGIEDKQQIAKLKAENEKYRDWLADCACRNASLANRVEQLQRNLTETDAQNKVLKARVEELEGLLRVVFAELQPEEEILETYCDEGMSEPAGVIPVGVQPISFNDWIIQLKIKAKEAEDEQG